MRAGIILLLPLAGACSDTVAFLSLDLHPPTWAPEIHCDNDPRRPREVRVEVSCGGVSRSSTFDAAAATVNLSGVPLGNCEIRASAENALGRTVISGNTTVEIARGDNDPIEITLTEEICALGCDPDDDGIASEDEAALGLDPTVTDSDSDGVSDGVELQQCCSDPTDGSAPRGCGLFIEAVTPPFGAPEQLVILETTAELKDPAVELGTAPLDNLTTGTRIVAGQIDRQAVLGTVSITSGDSAAVYRHLYAVVSAPPVAVLELDRQAGGRNPLIQNVVDAVATNRLLWILGHSGPVNGLAAGQDTGTDPSRSPPEGSTNQRVVLVTVNRADGRTQRSSPATGKPLSLAADDAGVTMLVDRGGVSTVYTTPVTGDNSSSATLDLPTSQAGVAVLREPGGRMGQVLLNTGLLRVDFGVQPPRAAQLSFVSRSELSDQGASASAECTGFAYHASSDTTLAWCDLPTRCSSAPCPVRPHLVSVGPVSDCLALDTTSTQRPQDCVHRIDASSGQRSVGSPVVDPSSGRVYLLTDAGVVVTALADRTLKGGVLNNGRLLPWIPFKWQGHTSHPRTMVGHISGALLVANGNQVLVLQPRKDNLRDRYGGSFLVGDSYSAEVVATPPNGTTIDVLRFDNLWSLMTVCVRRCPACPCR